jgi:hypothetical protein
MLAQNPRTWPIGGLWTLLGCGLEREQKLKISCLPRRAGAALSTPVHILILLYGSLPVGLLDPFPHGVEFKAMLCRLCAFQILAD